MVQVAPVVGIATAALWRACTAEADAGTTLRRRKLDEVFVQPAASRRVARADVTLPHPAGTTKHVHVIALTKRRCAVGNSTSVGWCSVVSRSVAIGDPLTGGIAHVAEALSGVA